MFHEWQLLFIILSMTEIEHWVFHEWELMFVILNRTEKIHLFLPPNTHSMFSLVHCTLKTQMRQDSSVYLYLHHIKEGVFNNKHETYALNIYVKKQNMIYCRTKWYLVYTLWAQSDTIHFDWPLPAQSDTIHIDWPLSAQSNTIHID